MALLDGDSQLQSTGKVDHFVTFQHRHLDQRWSGQPQNTSIFCLFISEKTGERQCLLIDQFFIPRSPSFLLDRGVRSLRVMTTVVPFHPSHLPGIYAVCMESSEPGWRELIPDANPDLLGHVYAGPYAIHAPQLARCVVDEIGVAGYILATADSASFWQWQDLHWWTALRAQYPRRNETSWNKKIIDLIHDAPRSPDDVVRSFPAHFHIDLLPRAQGAGFGRALIEQLITDLSGMGVPGLHLDVGRDNHNAIEFYRHLGFEVSHTAAESHFMTVPL